jgi:hypothetical protein
MPDSLYPYQPGGYQPPPSPAVYPITDAAPPYGQASPVPAPATSPVAVAGPRRGPSTFVRALPAIASVVPLGFGRLWYLHGGHSIAAYAVGGLAVVGYGLAISNRSGDGTALWLAAAASMLAEFAIDAYAPEIYLPMGLAALTLAGAYTAATKVWRKAAQATAKHAERRELRALDAGTTVHVAQIQADRDITIAAIQARAQVRGIEIQASAMASIAMTAGTPYPLLELSPQAKAMLERSPDLGLSRALEPGRQADTPTSDAA